MSAAGAAPPAGRTAERVQSYANHKARVPLVWLTSGIVIAIELARQVWLAFARPSWTNAWYALVVLAVLVVWYQARRRAQIVQDRVIRLEMRVRLERVLGAARRADFERLATKQLVALRFAGDAELPALVDDVLAGRLAEPDEIKRRVKDWQADWLRV